MAGILPEATELQAFFWLLRKVVREFLEASHDRFELKMSDLRAEWRGEQALRLTPVDEERHRKRLRREIRATNGEVRRALKKIPWR